MLWRELGLTLALLITACSLIAIGLNQLLQSPDVMSLIGEASLFRNLLNIGGLLSTFVLSIWLTGPIASAIISFLDEMALAVEAGIIHTCLRYRAQGYIRKFWQQ